MIQPELWVDRGADAVDFYASAFGARVLHRVGEGQDIVAQLPDVCRCSDDRLLLARGRYRFPRPNIRPNR